MAMRPVIALGVLVMSLKIHADQTTSGADAAKDESKGEIGVARVHQDRLHGLPSIPQSANSEFSGGVLPGE